MKFAPLIVALALGLAGPAAAQDFVADKVVKSVDAGDLAAVVGALGHQVLERSDGEEIVVLAENPDQIRYVLLGTACGMNGVEGCQGVLMLAQFDLPPSATYESVARANLDFAALNIWVDFGEKSLGFSRYVVLDEGVTMANLRANVEVLLSLIGEAYPVAAGEEAAAGEAGA
jgi:hypothetical protein